MYGSLLRNLPPVRSKKSGDRFQLKMKQTRANDSAPKRDPVSPRPEGARTASSKSRSPNDVTDGLPSENVESVLT